MSTRERISRVALAGRALRVRNACVRDLARRRRLRMPEPMELEPVGISASLQEAWQWWSDVCQREEEVFANELLTEQSSVSFVLRAAVAFAFMLAALAVSTSPLGP